MAKFNVEVDNLIEHVKCYMVLTLGHFGK
jgi:hypothetical protein